MIPSAPDLTEQLQIFRDSHEWRRVKSTGQIWHYLFGGTGNMSVILLPGAGGNAEDLFHVMAALENDFHVVSISIPEGVRSVFDIAQAITAVMDDQGVRGAYVLGHSLGGMIAECFMTKYPDRTDGLILANVAHYSTFRESLVRGVLMIAPYLPRQFVDRKIGDSIKRLLANSSDADFWIQFLEYGLVNTSQVALSDRIGCYVDAIEHYPVKSLDLDNWNRRVLIIESDQETGFIPDEKAALRQLYLDANVHVIRGAGHLSPYTHPKEFIAAVRYFLQH